MSIRLLTIIGSGETSPTMVKVQKDIISRIRSSGISSPKCVLLTTPFGFQENVEHVTVKIITYFRQSIGVEMEKACLDSGDPIIAQQATNLLSQASLVFSGPGSPSYALRYWENTAVPKLLAKKLTHGGAITFASAAALTLGQFTVPVYEIYKVGTDPYWLEGLNLLKIMGINASVIPHYNNAEGGNHDTRYCYLGERRLGIMENQLADDSYIIGIDEHTACIFDLDSSTVSVDGNGMLTIRYKGVSKTFASGTVLEISQLNEIAASLSTKSTTKTDTTAETLLPSSPLADSPLASSPMLDMVGEHENSFYNELASKNLNGMLKTVLSLEEQLHMWSTDTLQSDNIDQARTALRNMIVELTKLALAAFQNPIETMTPLIDYLVALRDKVRKEQCWQEADNIRNRLIELGIEIHDQPGHTTWSWCEKDVRDC
ncbi:MAG: hypothetical protein M1483_08520 [Actinobacteria bacterium]|nr:hypothetical protein [Actinomycetota bacterium]MCL6105648.1 hypothetical protein [Actinomycetota bacterium]